MIVAVIGSRDIDLKDVGKYIPRECMKLVSGGARGVDRAVREYADKNGIPIDEILPNYARYQRRAPLVRNKEIVDRAEIVIAFWNGRSRGTKFVIDYCKKIGKPCVVHRFP